MVAFTHIPVLLQEVLGTLSPQAEEVYVDATFGGGGYTRAILEAADCKVIGIDRDLEAIERAKLFQKDYPTRFDYAHAKFSEFPKVLDDLDIPKVDGIVFDLGVSSYQIDDPDRGFSFRFDAPLSMAMGCTELTAHEIVNHYSESDLFTILKRGEEPFARRIAKKIVERRVLDPIETTGQLASLIASCKPASKDGQSPATVTFQALRIFVNEELIELEKALQFCKNRLKPGARLVVVTFHSLEDRIVKEFMRDESGNTPLPSRHMPMKEPLMKPTFKLITKKAVAPTEDEMRRNPRSRSAKLRYAVRTDVESTDVNMGEVVLDV